MLVGQYTKGPCLSPNGRDVRVAHKHIGTSARGLVKRSTHISCRASTSGVEAEAKPGDRFYFNVTGFPFPLGPFFDRKTIRYEIEKGKIWTFEQPQSLGFSTVTINIRMTVIKLKSGGLWVHAPIAPTKECIRLLKDLGAPVEYIILPTFAYEHKIFVGPFSRKFPNAKVYVAPSQWSWPINLPPAFFGIFPKGELKDMDASAPWADEIEQKVFRPPDVGIGPYVEVAFFHKSTRSLIVTDAVVYIPAKPLEIIPVSTLLAQARDDGLNTFIAGDLTKEQVKSKTVRGAVPDSTQARIKGWMRTVLLVLYFGPYNLLEPQDSFNALVGKWIVSPVIRTLVYNQIPKSVTKWVDSIESDWNFNKIIPCHLAGPIRASPGDMSAAFSFSYDAAGVTPKVKEGLGGLLAAFQKPSAKLPEEDLGALTSLEKALKNAGAVYSDLE